MRGHDWPEPYTGRALHNPFLERWEAREEDLAAALDAEAQRFQDATAEGDFDRAVVWSGEGADLIRDVAPAARLLRRMGKEAEARLRSARGFLD